MATVRQFGAITKIEDQEDGTIKVWGIASSETVDHAGEKITAEAMKAALPDYARFPALREMHEPLAAGKVLEADVDGTGATQICAHVVDPLAITKVKTGVYAGFSVGGKVLKRDPADRSVITGLRLVEISLVDSPCNPDAVISMWKADMTQYTPSGDEVVAKARTLAEEAGSKRYKDFVYKAREMLKAEAAAAEFADEDDDVDAADVTKAASAEIVDAPTGSPEAQAEGAEVEADGADEAKLAADQPDADADVSDPAAALAAAIEKANDAVTAPIAAVEPSGPFTDMAKAGAALRLMTPSNELAKSLWQIETLASIMERFQSLAACIAYEAESEKDGSEQPAKAAEVLASMGELLIMAAKEEVAEAIAGLPSVEAPMVVIIDDDCPEVVMLANEIVDVVKADTDLLEKAGARNSKRDAEMIQQSHDHMAKLGAVCDKDNCAEKDDTVEEANKALTAENERLTKALVDAAPAVEELTKKFETTIAELTKRLEQVESEPAAPKTAGGPLRAVTKTQDISPGTDTGGLQISPEDFQKALDSMPEAERGQLLLRVALSNPQLVKTARAAA